jgi:4-aminobutyrate aminotransferase-like enzyme
MTKNEILLAAKEHIFPAVIHYFAEPLVLDHAKAQYIWDIEGKQYLDFFGGIVTVSVGHGNDKVREAVHKQVDKLMHVSTLFATEPQVALAKTIADKTPGKALSQAFFTNSGTEANETAVMLARLHTGSSDIVALRHGYHGRTEAGRGMTGQSTWRGPLPSAAGYLHIHSAYCYRCPFGLTYPSCEMRCAYDAKDAIETMSSGRVAALIAEPILGSGGFVVPPKEYFKIVVDIVKQHGGIFISDEVQTGWGRTGKWFGIENWDVTPEIMTFAKGLGNGLPIGATIAKPEVAKSLQFLTLSTFGGNPVTNAAAKAVIDFVEAENLLANCETVGVYLRSKLLELQAKYPLIGEVRGMGLMQALELVKDRGTKEHASRETAMVMEAARKEGLLIGKGGLRGNVLRISPPMNISTADVDEFARLLDRSFAAVPNRVD